MPVPGEQEQIVELELVVVLAAEFLRQALKRLLQAVAEEQRQVVVVPCVVAAGAEERSEARSAAALGQVPSDAAVAEGRRQAEAEPCVVAVGAEEPEDAERPMRWVAAVVVAVVVVEPA